MNDILTNLSGCFAFLLLMLIDSVWCEIFEYSVTAHSSVESLVIEILVLLLLVIIGSSLRGARVQVALQVNNLSPQVSQS